MGASPVEEIQILAKNRRRILQAGIVAVFLAGCTTKTVMEDDDAKFKDINDEFSKVVKVEPASPPLVSGVVKAPEPTSKPVVAAPAKKLKKARPMTKVQGPRMPKIEDTEGFSGRRPLVDPLGVGEQIVMSVDYLNMSAGEVSFTVHDLKTVNDRRAYPLVLRIKTSKTFSLFYAVDNMASTYIDYENLVPLTYEAEMKESSRLKEVRTFYDWDKNEGQHWEKTVKKREPEKKKKIVWSIEPFSQSYLSTVYYMRMFQLVPGKKLSFYIADAGKNYTFHAEVLRREKLETAIGELDTVVVRPSFESDGAFKASGENLIWFTDDDRKFVVKIEAKIKIGTIVAKIKSIEKGRRD